LSEPITRRRGARRHGGRPRRASPLRPGPCIERKTCCPARRNACAGGLTQGVHAAPHLIRTQAAAHPRAIPRPASSSLPGDDGAACQFTWRAGLHIAPFDADCAYQGSPVDCRPAHPGSVAGRSSRHWCPPRCRATARSTGWSPGTAARSPTCRARAPPTAPTSCSGPGSTRRTRSGPSPRPATATTRSRVWAAASSWRSRDSPATTAATSASGQTPPPPSSSRHTHR
jgi:hypothetical protein